MRFKRRMSNYRRGRAREYRVKQKLLRGGAIWVVRSYGSHGLFDLTAVFPTHVKLIQVKKNYINPRELGELREFARAIRAPNISAEIWFTSPRRVVHLTPQAPQSPQSPQTPQAAAAHSRSSTRRQTWNTSRGMRPIPPPAAPGPV